MGSPINGLDMSLSRFVNVNLGTVKEPVEESVFLDPLKGPLLYVRDGTTSFVKWRPHNAGHVKPHVLFRSQVRKETWTDLTSTEQNYVLTMVAKRNLRTREDAEDGRGKMPDLSPWVQAAAEAAAAQSAALEAGDEGAERE
eukprot:CAMPEP_0204559926 /NCGR_PEP_ID=MMETSP0661-20131031/32312_1 /ASSEMBLY_ACC=CAM_ASM_000606 /TAXON_ID=109239 /ORGANISM="Alexandrium margalefi, Strain AMGDE01CS-322" /LENGTH=140 /DNA_ID=CAMNT_0051567201 /DNA_START=51 /DNA_END=473 /DNA_ORIENTATION=-